MDRQANKERHSEVHTHDPRKEVRKEVSSWEMEKLSAAKLGS